MYKVLAFLDNQVSQIEEALNDGNYEIVHVWNHSNRIIFIVKDQALNVNPTPVVETGSPKQRGRKRIQEGE